MNEGALAKLDDDAAIAELASGVLSKQIAARYGVTPYAIRKRLAKHPDYKQAIADQAESLVEHATEEAMNCGMDTVAIARARVKVDTAHKYAAARDPAHWGQRTQIDVNIDIGTALQQLSERLQSVSPAQQIEGEAERIEDNE